MRKSQGGTKVTEELADIIRVLASGPTKRDRYTQKLSVAINEKQT